MKLRFIQQLRYVGRDHLGTPATGVGQIHQAEAKLLLQQTFNWWTSVCLSVCPSVTRMGQIYRAEATAPAGI